MLHFYDCAIQCLVTLLAFLIFRKSYFCWFFSHSDIYYSLLTVILLFMLFYFQIWYSYFHGSNQTFFSVRFFPNSILLLLQFRYRRNWVWFSNPYIFATQCRTIDNSNYVRSNNLSKNYQKHGVYTISLQRYRIRKFEFVKKKQFLCNTNFFLYLSIYLAIKNQRRPVIFINVYFVFSNGKHDDSVLSILQWENWG